MTQLLEMTTITTDADTEIRIVLFDLGIRLYTPHREFILSEIFKDKRYSLRVNLSKILHQNIEQEIKGIIEGFRPSIALIDPWTIFPCKRDVAFQTANLITDTDFNLKSQLIFNTLLKDNKTLKIILGSWMDPHSFSNEDAILLDQLLSRKDFYLWGIRENDFVEYNQSPLEAAKSTRPHTRYFRDRILNTEKKSKIIPYLHSIPRDFYHKALKFKDWEDFEFNFHVPGSLSSYPNRQAVRKIIMETSSSEYKTLVSLNQTLRTNFSKLKSPFLLDAINYTYYDLIKKSSVNFVDGGRMQYVTMKYLEVPMCGSLILSPKTTSLEKYGFVSNTHYVEYNAAPEFFFLNNQSKSEWNEIRENAHKLILEKHSTDRRIKQLMFMFKYILKYENHNKFTYDNGNLVNSEKQVID